VKSAAIYAFSLAHYCIVCARARAADSINARVRLAAQNDRLHEECALLREELRIKDARTAQIVAQRRPHCGPLERMAILEPRLVVFVLRGLPISTGFFRQMAARSQGQRIAGPGHHSIRHRIAIGPQQGRKVFTLQPLPACEPEDQFAATVGQGTGFSLHAGVAARVDERQKQKRLCRYTSRPAVSEQLLALTHICNLALHLTYGTAATSDGLSMLLRNRKSF